VSALVSKTFHATAESPERAAELIGSFRDEWRKGENYVHVDDDEVSWDIESVTRMTPSHSAA
jgi:hypothetical protein